MTDVQPLQVRLFDSREDVGVGEIVLFDGQNSIERVSQHLRERASRLVDEPLECVVVGSEAQHGVEDRRVTRRSVDADDMNSDTYSTE